jgi:hypothetical protein
MRGAIPSLPNTPSWRGAKLKHRDSFTFTFACIMRVFDKMVLKRKFSSKREEVAWHWRKLHNEELYNTFLLFTSIIKVVKSRMMKWTIHEIHVEGLGNAYKILVEKPEC